MIRVNRLPLLVILFLIFNVGFSQQTFYFIGDAGKNKEPNICIDSLKRELQKSNQASVIFLGDNVYPQGIEPDSHSSKYEASRQRLESQLFIGNNFSGNMYFVPGNHDWRQNKRKGLQAVMAQQNLVEQYLDKTKVKNKHERNFLPHNGLPGPFVSQIANVALIFIDIDWWLQDRLGFKIGLAPGKTKEEMKNDFFLRLDSILASHQKQHLLSIICAHHPLFSNGHHGDKKPVLRTINNYTPISFLGGNRLFNQDIEQPKYQKLKRQILEVLNKYEGIIYVSGHDHNAQYHHHLKNHFFISGNGSKKSSFTTQKYQTIFQEDRYLGYLKITVEKDLSWRYEFRFFP